MFLRFTDKIFLLCVDSRLWANAFIHCVTYRRVFNVLLILYTVKIIMFMSGIACFFTYTKLISCLALLFFRILIKATVDARIMPSNRDITTKRNAEPIAIIITVLFCVCCPFSLVTARK